MPSKQSKAKATVHLTPPRAKKQRKTGVSALPGLEGKGFFTPESNAFVTEVLTNLVAYPTDALAAKRLRCDPSTVSRKRARLKAALPPTVKRTPVPLGKLNEIVGGLQVMKTHPCAAIGWICWLFREYMHTILAWPCIKQTLTFESLFCLMAIFFLNY